MPRSQWWGNHGRGAARPGRKEGYEAGEDNFYSTEDVYEWLADKVTTIWTDPVCGNNKCEMPYEFPAYHRCDTSLPACEKQLRKLN